MLQLFTSWHDHSVSKALATTRGHPAPYYVPTASSAFRSSAASVAHASAKISAPQDVRDEASVIAVAITDRLLSCIRVARDVVAPYRP